jgi:hypothetical protein
MQSTPLSFEKQHGERCEAQSYITYTEAIAIHQAI